MFHYAIRLLAALLLTLSAASPADADPLFVDAPAVIDMDQQRAEDDSIVCTGVAGWPGDMCHGQAYMGALGTLYGCDALCTWNGADVINGIVEGEGAIPAGDHDDFTLDIDDPLGHIAVRTHDADGDCSAAADTVVELWRWHAGNWDLVSSHDDVDLANDARCSALDVDVGVGRYRVRIKGYGDSRIDHYRFYVAHAVDTEDDDPTSANGHVQAGGDDLFLVRGGDETSVCTTDRNDGCPGDTVLHAYDPETGEWLTDDDGGEGLCSCLDLPTDTDYLVFVQGYDDGHVGDYTLVVDRPFDGNNEEPICPGDCRRQVFDGYRGQRLYFR